MPELCHKQAEDATASSASEGARILGNQSNDQRQNRRPEAGAEKEALTEAKETSCRRTSTALRPPKPCSVMNYRSIKLSMLNQTVDGAVAGFANAPADDADGNDHKCPDNDPEQDLFQRRQSRCGVLC